MSDGKPFRASPIGIPFRDKSGFGMGENRKIGGISRTAAAVVVDDAAPASPAGWWTVGTIVVRSGAISSSKNGVMPTSGGTNLSPLARSYKLESELRRCRLPPG